MKTATPVYIASQHILWLHADGTATTIVARVGTPYQADAQTWACALALEGLDPGDGRGGDIYGISAMQALCLAVRMAALRLGHLLERGETLAHPADRSPWDRRALDAVFGMQAS